MRRAWNDSKLFQLSQAVSYIKDLTQIRTFDLLQHISLGKPLDSLQKPKLDFYKNV